MDLNANLATGVAFNKFERFIVTLSGKDTLHDTVGMAYQLSAEEVENSDKNTTFPEKTSEEKIPEVDLEVALVNGSQNLTHQNHLQYSISKNSQSRKDTEKKRRRAYEAKGTDIAPIVKNLNWKVKNF